MKHVLLICGVLLLPLGAEAQTVVVVSDNDPEIWGLPAISADGATIAYVVPFETLSDAERTTIAFLSTSDGTVVDSWTVLQRDDAGVAQPFTDDRGDTPWRRARNLTLHLRAGGYRALRNELEAANVEVEHRHRRVILRATSRRRVLWSGRLPRMQAFCGMSDERPRDLPPEVLNVWVDPGTRTALLEFGHTYASCMCPDDLAYASVSLAG